MKMTFFGAAGEVTGSCALLETGAARVLIDCGMHQGGRDEEARNRVPLPVRARELDAVLITHAHIDHIGRTPLLPGLGFKGPIYATDATCRLAPIMLRDSAKLAEIDASRDSVRNARRGLGPVLPLYTAEEVERVLPMFRPVVYGEARVVAPGVTARWIDAGHMIGSASIELTVDAAPRPRTIVFSGDIGHLGTALLNDPTVPPHADVVVMESTYGDRDHRSMDDTLAEFTDIIKEAVWEKQKVIIPAFAVGRSQQLIYHLGEIVETGRVPRFPFYLDSPMAADAVEVYREFAHLLDPATLARLRSGALEQSLTDLRILRSGDESRALNEAPGPMVIIAPSGMCTGGRVLHHLRHNLWKHGVHVVIVGFQGKGSLGRALVEKAPSVRIMRERIVVRAKVSTLGGFSAHAGKAELLAWASAVHGIDRKHPRFILTHGEDTPRASLARSLENLTGRPTLVPGFAETIDLGSLDG
ncbi:MAG: MBL fold metallo-hydrolase [Phycisphaeraceae bacterium]|nr:MAG: MBL fold metallo-hydrolase [Phycisphaeraceae bacterium]